MLTAQQLETYLTQHEWVFERVDENTLASGFQGKMAFFEFFVRLTADWIFFTIVPYTPAPKEDKALLSLYRRLLELNRTMNLAKFALDEEADVLLTVEMPTESITDSELKDAITALCFYADEHYLELLRLGVEAAL